MKIVNFFKRVETLEKLLPRYVDYIAFVSFSVILVLYLAFASGYLAYIQNYLINGFSKIEDIKIEGQKRTTQAEILKALNLDKDRHMASLDVESARKFLLSLPWVKTVSIKKYYPNHVVIQLIERSPYAIWQEGGSQKIIDHEGVVLYPFEEFHEHSYIPLVIGDGANLEAGQFIQACQALMKSNKNQEIQSILKAIKAYIWVDGRRWDLLLKNGIKIKLPEQAAFKRWKHFLTSSEQRGLLYQAVDAIDLRLSDRITVKLKDALFHKLEREAKEIDTERSKQERHIKGGLL